MSDSTRLGILGLGSVAATRVQCFADIDSAEIVQAWSRSAGTRQAFHDESGIPVADEWEQVCTSPDVDGVIICTPNACHYDMARLALGAGKHAFVETPLSLRYAEARELADAATAGGLVLQHAVTPRYHPDHAAHVEQLRRVGRLFFAVDVRTSDYGTHRPWYDDPDASGGARAFLPYFLVDWLEAFGEVRRVEGTECRQDAWDVAVLLVSFAEGGTLTIQTSHGRGLPELEQVNARQVVGSAGTILGTSGQNRVFVQDGEELVLEYRQAAVYPCECQAFEDAIRGRRDPGPELERDLRALQLVDEGLRS